LDVVNEVQHAAAWAAPLNTHREYFYLALAAAHR
jgi:hypothetical protein